MQLIVFLRSDIFKYVIGFAAEPDKISNIILKWDKPELFFNIIEERFVALNEDNISAESLWEKYIVKTVGDENIKTYILDRIFPRPRDIIYFFKKAQECAILKSHEKIEESDIVDAYEDYSKWFFSTLMVENGVTYKQMEDFLYSMIGVSTIIDKNEIERMMKDAKIDASSENLVETFIDYLVTLSILAREVSLERFEFEYEFIYEKRNKALSKKLNTRRFRINPALYPYLGCQLVYSIQMA